MYRLLARHESRKARPREGWPPSATCRRLSDVRKMMHRVTLPDCGPLPLFASVSLHELSHASCPAFRSTEGACCARPLWKARGDVVRATETASNAGGLAALLLIGLGVVVAALGTTAGSQYRHRRPRPSVSQSR